VGAVTDLLDQPVDTVVAESSAPEVVTLENLRAVSPARSLGLGIAVVAFALIEILYFGLNTDRSDETTIQFAYNTANNVPPLSTVQRVVVMVLGAACVAGGITLLVRHRLRALGVLLVIVGAVLGAWVLALLLHFDGAGDTLKTLTVPTAATAWVLGGVSLAGGIYLIVSRSSRAAFPIFFVATGLFILAFLIWIARGSNVGTVPPLALTSVLWVSFISATPLIYGSLSGTMCERSGVVNIAIEGQFMFGAMSSAIVTSAIGGTVLGFFAGTATAALIGGLIGLVLAYMALHFRANQIIVGVVIVAFCTAMVQFMMSQVLNNKQSLNTGVGTLPIAIPGLSRIPFFGPILFDQTYFVYLAVVLVAIVNFMLFRTRQGLRVRSVGEKPQAAETVGLSVPRIRYGMVILGGLVAGIGGAVFTIGEGIPMGVGITGGEGFIALAIMIFGRWRPWSALTATMLFGFTIAIGSQLQLYLNQLVIPTELIYALPYLITIAAVAGLVGRVRPPAADGIPYVRE
jgi:general nucleoside transport system permease protein